MKEQSVDEPRIRIKSQHTDERGRGLKVEHLHGVEWLPMSAGLPMLSDDQPRRWVVLYRCSIECGETLTSEVPA
jgi:hypothetical protein